jgi:hypothetical protein
VIRRHLVQEARSRVLVHRSRHEAASGLMVVARGALDDGRAQPRRELCSGHARHTEPIKVLAVGERQYTARTEVSDWP